MTVSADNLLWIDLEMTGLEPQHDQIIEVATLVTDKDLNILAEGPVMAIYQPDSILEGMDEWNQTHHGRSGLIDRVKASRTTLEEASRATIAFAEQYVPAGRSPMCGNSICQDRRFMARLMPELEAFFHYRNLDVSSVKEILRRWAPEITNGVKKQGAHLAMDDIRDSVAELQHYRKHAFTV